MLGQIIVPKKPENEVLYLIGTCKLKAELEKCQLKMMMHWNAKPSLHIELLSSMA